MKKLTKNQVKLFVKQNKEFGLSLNCFEIDYEYQIAIFEKIEFGDSTYIEVPLQKVFENKILDENDFVYLRGIAL